MTHLTDEDKAKIEQLFAQLSSQDYNSKYDFGTDKDYEKLELFTLIFLALIKTGI